MPTLAVPEPAALLQVPPLVASVNDVVPPLAHNEVVPVMAAAPLTVSVIVASVPHPVV